MSRYGDMAVDYFKRGYNCAQSVAAPFAEELGLPEETALRLTCGFGGGIGRLREVCGAFCGVTMVVSMKYADAADPQSKSRIYAIVQQLAEEYKKSSGRNTYLCRDLLVGACATGGAQAEVRTPAYYKRRPCAELVRTAAELAAEYLAQHPESENVKPGPPQ